MTNYNEYRRPKGVFWVRITDSQGRSREVLVRDPFVDKVAGYLTHTKTVIREPTEDELLKFLFTELGL